MEETQRLEAALAALDRDRGEPHYIRPETLIAANARIVDYHAALELATRHEITDEDLKRLSPLQHQHIKMLGNFPFTLPHELAAGQRRQLRGLGDRA